MLLGLGLGLNSCEVGSYPKLFWGTLGFSQGRLYGDPLSDPRTKRCEAIMIGTECESPINLERPCLTLDFTHISLKGLYCTYEPGSPH